MLINSYHQKYILKKTWRNPKYPKIYPKKDMKEKCLTRTYTKTSHMTWTLYIKIWAIKVHVI